MQIHFINLTLINTNESNRYPGDLTKLDCQNLID